MILVGSVRVCRPAFLCFFNGSRRVFVLVVCVLFFLMILVPLVVGSVRICRPVVCFP